MNVTAKLLRVFLVDKQLWGLRSNLDRAERFLRAQTGQFNDLSATRDSLQGQLRQLQATASERELEAKSLEEKVEKLREQMNSANTNKEYKAFLTEVNTFKTEKDRMEEEALGLLEQVEQLKDKLAETEEQVGEREKVCQVAAGDRDERQAEIADRVKQLETERVELAGDVPGEALRTYEQLLETLEDEAMASVEIQDRKRHEFTCGACMMTLPVEIVSALMSHGSLTRCVSCGCICYMTEDSVEAMKPASSKR